jgi:hypothetical protein
MPRTARASVGGVCYHVLNRGNARAQVFHDAADYEGFVELVGLACRRMPMRVLAYCVMPNQPQTEQKLAAVRRSVNRGTPLGAEEWARRLARRFGLEFTLRPRG